MAAVESQAPCTGAPTPTTVAGADTVLMLRGWVYGVPKADFDGPAGHYARIERLIVRRKVTHVIFDGDLLKRDSYTMVLNRLMVMAAAAQAEQQMLQAQVRNVDHMDTRKQILAKLRFVAFKAHDKLHKLRAGFKDDDFGVPTSGYPLWQRGACEELMASAIQQGRADTGDGGKAAVAMAYRPTKMFTSIGVDVPKGDYWAITRASHCFVRQQMCISQVLVASVGGGAVFTREMEEYSADGQVEFVMLPSKRRRFDKEAGGLVNESTPGVNFGMTEEAKE